MGESAIAAAELETLIREGVPLVGSYGVAVESVGAGTIRLRMPYREDFVRPGGTVTGPALFGLADVALYGAVLSLIGRVELAAQDYGTNGYLDERVAVPLLIFQRPGSNALETAERLQATMAELSRSFPEGLRYDIVYNPTEFIAESVNEVIKTIFEAVVLVVIVVILFLQTWRASIIPILAIPVSLVGTFTVLALLGYSLNTLSLFGLVLAIGIVVDDAIVVVENVERNIELGLSPLDAAHQAMREVSGPIIAITLVLCAVFVPMASSTA